MHTQVVAVILIIIIVVRTADILGGSTGQTYNQRMEQTEESSGKNK